MTFTVAQLATAIYSHRGSTIADAIRQIGVSDHADGTFYRWRKQGYQDAQARHEDFRPAEAPEGT